MAFDATVFVYLFESTGQLAAAAIAMANAVSARRLTGVVSSVALAEVIVRPIRIGDDTMGERYADAIRSIENRHVVPVTIEIAVEAGFVRGRTSLTLADAIHLAMARQAGASAFVTNDRRLRSMPELAVIQLADLVA